ncbi:Protein ACCELERATED CELL DEATH 6 [Bienertia sinuspersici]
MLVATLVATVTFAAGFTLPGGYNQSDKDPNVGMAVLPDKWAFKSFIICNTAALYSAILCVVTLIWAHLGDLKLILVSLKVCAALVGFRFGDDVLGVHDGYIRRAEDSALAIVCGFRHGMSLLVLVYFFSLFRSTTHQVLRILWCGHRFWALRQPVGSTFKG